MRQVTAEQCLPESVVDEFDVAEHREIERDHHDSDTHSHDHGQQWFEKGSQIVHGHFDLLIVELADLLQHSVQGTGLLAHLDHLGHQGGLSLIHI